MRRRLTIAIVGAICLAVIAFVLTRPREPAVDGHPISYWMDSLAGSESQRAAATNAFRKLGTNALPWLVEHRLADPNLAYVVELPSEPDVFHFPVGQLEFRGNRGRDGCYPMGVATQVRALRLHRIDERLYDSRGESVDNLNSVARCEQVWGAG